MQIPILIQRYLAAHKRLIVPQLGAFVVKEPGTVLFTEMLKRDDGVLRALLAEAGADPLKAAGEIDRFVFEVRHAVERGEEYVAPGLGTFGAGPNHTIAFRYEPAAEAAAAPAPAQATRPAAAPAPADTPAPAAPKSGQASRNAAPAETPEAAPQQKERAESRVSMSAKRNPDPSIKGLRYGRPHKNTDAYSYVDRPVRRRGDLFIWIALAVALLALAAIGFGVYRETFGEEADTELYFDTTPDASETPAADPAENL